MIQVLIVEDDTRISKIHKMFVEKLEGFEVCGIANSLDDAESMLDILDPDLILLDLYFPEGNGLQFLKKLRSEEKSVDVILITAAKEVESLRKAIRRGAFDYIIKPVIFDRFKDSLERFEKHHTVFQKMDQVDQENVDSILGAPQGEMITPGDMPKGIDPITLQKIKEIMVDFPEGLSAEKAGETVGASRSTARRYLEYLVSLGHLSADQQYGTVGRPERCYRLKEH